MESSIKINKKEADSWFMLPAQMDRHLWFCWEVLHLNRVCEHTATDYLIATQTCCVPGTGTVSMAHKDGEYSFYMLDGVEPTNSTLQLVL